MTPGGILKEFFGYETFREGQKNIIDAILSRNDAFAIMPTGAGKSICYQVPALLLEGLTIVISPLISLMQDQVKALNDFGIKSAFINSSLTENQLTEIISNAKANKYKLIYIAPERLENMKFIDFAINTNISMITVDEAHCISQWGQDFRPSYLKILEFIKKLPKRPIISAFTATATEEVKNDIICTLNLNNPTIIQTTFDRPNLIFSVENNIEKNSFIIDYIKKHKDDSGIIYCSTRKNVETLYTLLSEFGFSITKYHAGLAPEERKNNQDDFIYDRIPIIIATNAFGMGINKSNVRYVIHYNMPQSMENYYQEAGRAGRDGDIAQCILLFSAQDVIINKFLLDKKEFKDMTQDDIELVKQRDNHRLQIMETYCKTTECLRNYILEYFGEKRISICNNCGNCNKEFVVTDMTYEAKQIINCVAESKGKYGIQIILGTVLGLKRARLKELGTDNYKSYSKLKDSDENKLKQLINHLLEEKYLIQTEEKYSVLRMTKKIYELKNDDNKILVKLPKENEFSKEISNKRNNKTDSLTSAGFELLNILKQLRLKIAKDESMPPYIIFSDKTLIELCQKLPVNEQQMLNISGVGRHKYDKYGSKFIETIQNYVSEHPNTQTCIIEEETDLETEIKKKNRRSVKSEFKITNDDAKNFIYGDLYYISDIKANLDSICSLPNVKKVSTTDIWNYLKELGFTDEREITTADGIIKEKFSTIEGEKQGIKTITKISQYGKEYKLLKYPPQIQKIIVEHYINQQ